MHIECFYINCTWLSVPLHLQPRLLSRSILRFVIVFTIFLWFIIIFAYKRYGHTVSPISTLTPIAHEQLFACFCGRYSVWTTIYYTIHSFSEIISVRQRLQAFHRLQNTIEEEENEEEEGEKKFQLNFLKFYATLAFYSTFFLGFSLLMHFFNLYSVCFFLLLFHIIFYVSSVVESMGSFSFPCR